MASTSTHRGATDARAASGQRLLHPGLKVPFVLLVLCFAAWGTAANLTDVLVGVFRGIFAMSNFQSALVQFAYYGAYFCLAVPAALINRRFGYKTGLLTGLGLAALGGLLFYPASQLLAYLPFLVALFVLAAGLSILETSANPFVIAMGPERNATQRLNLAQAFNPVGANIGVALGALLILPNLTPPEEREGLGGADLVAAQERDLSVVLGPYLGIAAVLVVIWLLIASRKMPTPAEEGEGGLQVSRGVLGRLFANRHYRYGVVAQFFNVAAQTCTWTFTIQYATDVVGTSAGAAGWYLQASLLTFLVFRFLMTYLLGIFRPSRLLLVMALVGVGLAVVAVLSPNLVGLLAVVAISASLSLMFPTIYGVALEGLGQDTKFGAAGLVMAILGGALLPLVQGGVMDAVDTQTGYVVTAACLAVVAGYALFDLRSSREPHAGAPAPADR
jgi:FHS family L-fucose permease-like MFS transporter